MHTYIYIHTYIHTTYVCTEVVEERSEEPSSFCLPLTSSCDRLLLFVYFQVNNGVVYLDYEDSHHHGPLLCSFQ